MTKHRKMALQALFSITLQYKSRCLHGHRLFVVVAALALCSEFEQAGQSLSE